MVIEFYAKQYPDLPNPEMGPIKKEMGYTEDDGTPLEGVRRVNRILKGSVHSLEFGWNDYAKYDDIKEEIDERRPVIAWLKRDKFAEWSHSVVIRGRTEDDLRIKVNDPDKDALRDELATADFMREWTNSDRILIRAKVTERPHQRELKDYIDE